MVLCVEKVDGRSPNFAALSIKVSVTLDSFAMFHDPLLERIERDLGVWDKGRREDFLWWGCRAQEYLLDRGEMGRSGICNRVGDRGESGFQPHRTEERLSRPLQEWSETFSISS